MIKNVIFIRIFSSYGIVFEKNELRHLVEQVMALEVFELTFSQLEE
jgi:hypothetical protein